MKYLMAAALGSLPFRPRMEIGQIGRLWAPKYGDDSRVYQASACDSEHQILGRDCAVS